MKKIAINFKIYNHNKIIIILKINTKINYYKIKVTRMPNFLQNKKITAHIKTNKTKIAIY
jgi:hypothetical protein